MDILKQIEKLGADTSYVLITLVEASRSVPQEVGAKMLVTSGCVAAPLDGTIGGGRVEKESVIYAVELLKSSSAKSELKHFHLSNDLEMACGGEVTLFFEVVRTKHWNISIFGAGHVCQTLVGVLATLDCHVTCFDSRQEWLDKLPESSKLTKHLVPMSREGVEPFSHLIPKNSFHLVMTHGHLLDFPVAKQIFDNNSEIKYLGIIGSSSKAKLLCKKLVESGVEAKRVDEIYSPVGLPIGNNTPAEIAISIVAQLLEVRDR